MTATPWFERTACTPDQTHLFYPDDGKDFEAAKAICSSCAVAEPCLLEALQQEQGKPVYLRYGMRGRLTPTARHKLDATAPGHDHRTHCKHGHQLEGNSFVNNRGLRICTTCKEQARDRYTAKQRSAA